MTHTYEIGTSMTSDQNSTGSEIMPPVILMVNVADILIGKVPKLPC